MTPFEQVMHQHHEGNLKTPTVTFEGKAVDYFKYQVATHHFNLKLMARGMTFRGIKLKDIKHYYGLTKKSALECLEEYQNKMQVYGYNLKTK